MLVQKKDSNIANEWSRMISFSAFLFSFLMDGSIVRHTHHHVQWTTILMPSKAIERDNLVSFVFRHWRRRHNIVCAAHSNNSHFYFDENFVVLVQRYTYKNGMCFTWHHLQSAPIRLAYFILLFFFSTQILVWLLFGFESKTIKLPAQMDCVTSLRLVFGAAFHDKNCLCQQFMLCFEY